MNEKQMLELILKKVTGIEGDVAVLKTDVADLKVKMTRVEHRLDVMELRMESMDKRMSFMEERMRNFELILKNELFFSIQASTDGHQNLLRKLHEVIRNQESCVSLTVRTNLLEADMRIQKTETKALREKIG